MTVFGGGWLQELRCRALPDCPAGLGARKKAATEARRHGGARQGEVLAAARAVRCCCLVGESFFASFCSQKEGLAGFSLALVAPPLRLPPHAGGGNQGGLAGAADQPPGQLGGGFAVAWDDDAADDRSVVAFGGLHEASSAGGEVVADFGEVGADSGVVDDVEVGFHADFKLAAIGEAEGGGVVGGLMTRSMGSWVPRVRSRVQGLSRNGLAFLRWASSRLIVRKLCQRSI